MSLYGLLSWSYVVKMQQNAADSIWWREAHTLGFRPFVVVVVDEELGFSVCSSPPGRSCADSETAGLALRLPANVQTNP